MDFDWFLANEFLGNTGRSYSIAFGVFVGLFIFFKLFDLSIIAWLKRMSLKTKVQWDEVVVDFLDAIHWQFYAYIAFYIASLPLVLPESVDKVLYFLLLIFIAFYVVQGLSRVADYLTKKQVEKRTSKDRKENTSMILVFGLLFKIVLWSVAVLMVLANLGIEITPLIASLGIGGIAIALALQTVLGDLFSAFAIYFDKPFKEGDFIIIGADMGTVKHIGIKTTRIETLQGQELIVPNSELTSTRVNNYKRMEKRRVVFGIGVEYDTPFKKLKKINTIIESAISKTKNAQLDRVHFHKFGDSSLNYEVVYYVLSPDYTVYMNVQQEINFKIKEAFEKEKIEFAFPTQTVHVKK